MDAVIHLDVPDCRIGQEVSVFFRDRMHRRGICSPSDSDLVRCFECKYAARLYHYRNLDILDPQDYYQCDSPYPSSPVGFSHEGKWYCADGQRKELEKDGLLHSSNRVSPGVLQVQYNPPERD